MKGKITKSLVQKFNDSNKTGERLNDTLQPGFHARKLENGISLYYRYQSPNGERRTLSLGSFPSLSVEKARNIVSQYAGRIAGGEDIAETLSTRKRTKLNTGLAYIDEIYDSELKKKKDGKNTRADLFNHFGDLLAKPMPSLTKRMMSNWLAKKEASGLSPKTIKKVYAYFNAMLNHAVKFGGVLEKNPIHGFNLNLKKTSPEDELKLRQKRTFLNKDQTNKFFRALDLYQEEKRTKNKNSRSHGKYYLENLNNIEYVDYVKPIMLFLFYTGLRPGDALTMQWNEINFQLSSLTKVINKTSHKKEYPTTIPLSDKCIDVLFRWNQQNGSPTEGYVFSNPLTGKPYLKLHKPWLKIKILGDLPPELQNYTLRHNFISQLVVNGVNLLSIAKLATTSVEMIEKHYGHLQPDLQKKFINDFAEKYNF